MPNHFGQDQQNYKALVKLVNPLFVGIAGRS
jgi:hypothetical protein